MLYEVITISYQAAGRTVVTVNISVSITVADDAGAVVHIADESPDSSPAACITEGTTAGNTPS